MVAIGRDARKGFRMSDLGQKQTGAAQGDVRFTPDSDRESGHPQTVMSALPPKADMCSAKAHVCFGPIADIAYEISDLSGLSLTHKFYQLFTDTH